MCPPWTTRGGDNHALINIIMQHAMLVGLAPHAGKGAGFAPGAGFQCNRHRAAIGADWPQWAALSTSAWAPILHEARVRGPRTAEGSDRVRGPRTASESTHATVGSAPNAGITIMLTMQ